MISKSSLYSLFEFGSRLIYKCKVKIIVFENLMVNGRLYYDGMKEKPGLYKVAYLAGIYVGNHTDGIVFKRSE